MPLPEELVPFLNTKRFWTDFFFSTEPEEDSYSILQEEVTIEFPVTSREDTPCLVFTFYNDLSYCDLSLKAGSESHQLAWDDMGHWHPHVLRWDELDLVCRAIARLEPALPHPGLPLLLLHRFAPICGVRGGEDDDADLATSLLDAAWRRLGLFSDREIQRLIERNDARDAGFRWHRGRADGTWEIHQKDRRTEDTEDQTSWRMLYSLRWGPGETKEEEHGLTEQRDTDNGGDDEGAEEDDDHGGFPHSDLNAMLDAARDTVLKTAGGELVPSGILPSERPPKPHYTLRSQYSLNLNFPLQDGPRPLKYSSQARATNPLSRILTDLNLGWARATGSTSKPGPDGEYFPSDVSISVRIDGNRARGIQVIRETLQWASVPETTSLQTNNHKEIPLNLDQEGSPTGELYFQLMGYSPTVPGEDPYDARGMCRSGPPGEEPPTAFRVTFPATCVEALHSDPNATIEDPHVDGWLAVTARGDSEVTVHDPDTDGWLTVSAPDGGNMGVCFTPSENSKDLTTGCLAIRALSPSLAGIIYRLLASQELALFPPGLVTAEIPSKMDSETSVLQSDKELHETLAKGPYAWWSRPVDSP